MVIDYNKKTDYSKFRPIGYPVKHKKKIPFQPMLSLDLEYRSMVREIRRLDSILDGFVLESNDYMELVNDAYADNIHWSTKIEGNELSLEEVKRLTTKFSNGEFIETKQGPVQEIINHLYSFFLDDAFNLPWDFDTICKMHGILMKDVNPKVTPGQIRDIDVSVVDYDGTEYFIACPPNSIVPELESLIEWLNNSPYDEITTATLFFHEFESIHPFKDSNGRTGRTLFQVLLQEMGLKNCNLCKFEEKMLRRSNIYYDLLAFTDSTGIYSQLVKYFTESLLEAYQEAVELFGKKDRLKDMDENSRLIVKKSKEIDFFNLHQATSWIHGLTEQSVRMRLEDLVEAGILEKRGKTKGLVYAFKDPFRDIREKVRDS